MIIRGLIARIEVDTPFYTRTVEAICMKDPLFDLIIGNVLGARKPNDPNPEWGAVAATVTRAQARERGYPKQLKMKEVTTKMAVDKGKLVTLQEDLTFQKFKEAKISETRKDNRISYEKHGEIWYRVCQRKDEVEDTESRFWCPSLAEKESNGGSSRVFIWRTYGSEENRGQNPD